MEVLHAREHFNCCGTELSRARDAIALRRAIAIKLTGMKEAMPYAPRAHYSSSDRLSDLSRRVLPALTCAAAS